MTEKDVADTLRRKTAGAYVFALSTLAILATVGFLVIDHAFNEASDDSTVIHETGRQATLSQRIPLIVMALASDISGLHRPELLEELRTTVVGLEDAYHVATADRTQMPPNLRALFEDPQIGIDTLHERLLRVSRGVLAKQLLDLEASQMIMLDRTMLQLQLQAAVALRSSIASDLIARAGRTHLLVYVGTIVILLLEAVFLFAPLLKSQQRALQEAREANTALAAEKELRGLQRMFVAMVSHEFRTPLTIIDGKARQIVRRVREIDCNGITPRVSAIRLAVARMIDLIECILAAAKLENGQLSLQPKPCNLAQMLEVQIQTGREIFVDHSFACDIGPALEDVTLDPILIRQCIANLISNAGKYSEPGTKITVTAWRDPTSGDLRIDIKDTGIGIAADELGQIFQQFTRARSGVGRPGTGLGLHLVKSFVELHGGEISVNSDLGVGTAFSIVLPQPNGQNRELAA